MQKKSIFNPIGAFIKAKWNEYTPHGQFLFILALCAIAIDASISYEYGVSMTTLHGLGFALVAIACAVLPDQASLDWSRGKKGPALTLAALCLPLGIVAYQSHIGYGASVRVGDMQQTGMINARYDGGQMLVTSQKSEIDRLQKKAAVLDAAMDKLVNTKIGGWSVSVRPSSPEALDETIAAKVLEQEREGRTGKGPRYQMRTDELAHLRSLRATAVEIAENQDAYAKAQQQLVALTKDAGSMQYESSTVVNQNGVFAKLFKVINGAAPEEAIKADTVTQEFVNILMAGAGAAAFMILAPALMFAAGRNRRELTEGTGELTPRPMETYEAPSRPASQANVGPANDMLEALKEKLAGAKAPRLIVERANFRSAAV